MAVKAQAQVTLSRTVDVASVARYYKLQSSTLAKPAKPASNPPAGWTATEPAYTAGATNSLYTCELTVLSDNTWSYSDVSLSSSYEASKQAYNEAKASAEAAKDALNKTLYAACNTAAATAAKVPASTVAGFSLVAGASLRVKFTYANTAASPTLNVNSTGAKQIRLNGANSAYWTAGATVDMVYDGAYWQVCNTPLYGITATVGNPAGGNVYVDGEGVSVRSGSTVLARMAAGLIELGRNAATAVIKLCGGKGTVGYSQTSPLGEARPGLDVYVSGDDGINVFAKGAGTARIVSGAGDLSKAGCVVVGNQHVNAGVGNGSSGEFGSGGFFSLSPGEFRVDADRIVLNRCKVPVSVVGTKVLRGSGNDFVYLSEDVYAEFPVLDGHTFPVVSAENGDWGACGNVTVGTAVQGNAAIVFFKAAIPSGQLVRVNFRIDAN